MQFRSAISWEESEQLEHGHISDMAGTVARKLSQKSRGKGIHSLHLYAHGQRGTGKRLENKQPQKAETSCEVRIKGARVVRWRVAKQLIPAAIVTGRGGVPYRWAAGAHYLDTASSPGGLRQILAEQIASPVVI